jgi:hypothetical protein
MELIGIKINEFSITGIGESDVATEVRHFKRGMTLTEEKEVTAYINEISDLIFKDAQKVMRVEQAKEVFVKGLELLTVELEDTYVIDDGEPTIKHSTHAKLFGESLLVKETLKQIKCLINKAERTILFAADRSFIRDTLKEE